MAVARLAPTLGAQRAKVNAHRQDHPEGGRRHKPGNLSVDARY